MNKGLKGKTEAEKKADKWLEGSAVTENPRFWQTYLAFLKDAQARTSEGNYANLESLGRNWLKANLEHKKLSAITTQNWQECINAAAAKGLSKKTLKNIRGAISAFCRYCRKSGYTIAPTADIDIPKNAPVGERTILQPEQLRILFQKEDTKNDESSFFIHAYRFCVLTGLRRGELLGLKRTDIEDNVVRVRRSINKFGHVGPTKTAKSKRDFALNEHMKSVLADQMAMLRRNGIISPWVFPDTNGDFPMPATFYNRWCEYCQHQGFKTTLHELRHTLISIARTGISEDLLKSMVGHTKNMDTFGTYGHPISGEMQQVADALDLLFKKYLSSDTHKG